MDISVTILQEDRNRSTSKPAIQLLGIYPKDASSYHRDSCSAMFTAALFVIVRNWKQFRYSSTIEWIKKWCIQYMMQYYLIIKNDIMKLAGKWMKLEKNHRE